MIDNSEIVLYTIYFWTRSIIFFYKLIFLLSLQAIMCVGYPSGSQVSLNIPFLVASYKHFFLISYILPPPIHCSYSIPFLFTPLFPFPFLYCPSFIYFPSLVPFPSSFMGNLRISATFLVAPLLRYLGFWSPAGNQISKERKCE